MQIKNATPDSKAPASTPDPTAEVQGQLAAGLKTLKETTTRKQNEDRAKLEAFRKRIGPQLERAAKVVAEFKAIQEEFGPYLDGLIKLDMASLRTFDGYNHLGNIAEDAKNLKTDLDTAIRQLEALSRRVDALRPDTFCTFNVLEISDTVEFFRSGQERVREKIKTFVTRMSRFEQERRQ